MGFANNLIPVEYIADYLQEQERKGNIMEQKIVEAVREKPPIQKLQPGDDIVFDTLSEYVAGEPIEQDDFDIGAQGLTPEVEKKEIIN